MSILHWIWGLPQNLAGFIISRFAKYKKKYKINGITKTIYFMKFFNAGVSLGEFIILDPIWTEQQLETVIKHEYGHLRQSRMLGVFYLLVVGLPSVIGNIVDRFSKDDYRIRYNRYYNRYPENWADKLGKVDRFSKIKLEVVMSDKKRYWVEYNNRYVVFYGNKNIGDIIEVTLYDLEYVGQWSSYVL